jgi:Tol biopolymer transport system component
MLAILLALQTFVPPDSGEFRLRHIQQLTFGGQNAEAYFSRSGTQLILQRQESDSGCDQQYLINVDGTALRRVSSGLGRTTCGYFYADDRRILYASTEHVSPACPPAPSRAAGYVWALYDYDIYTANSDGSDRRRLTASAGYDAEATLSPDGRTIVFTSVRDGDLELYLMDVDGGNVRRLTHRFGYDGGAFFSHDGTKIVWRASVLPTAQDSADYRALLAQGLVRPSRMEIWVMDADGSHMRQVTSLGGANFAPYFTPDDRQILFSSNHHNPRGRNFDLFLVDLDGTGLEQVTTHGDFDGFPMFSPDGRRLVFASNRHGKVPGETNIFIADWVARP